MADADCLLPFARLVPSVSAVESERVSSTGHKQRESRARKMLLGLPSLPPPATGHWVDVDDRDDNIDDVDEDDDVWPATKSRKSG